MRCRIFAAKRPESFRRSQFAYRRAASSPRRAAWTHRQQVSRRGDGRHRVCRSIRVRRRAAPAVQKQVRARGPNAARIIATSSATVIASGSATRKVSFAARALSSANRTAVDQIVEREQRAPVLERAKRKWHRGCGKPYQAREVPLRAGTVDQPGPQDRERHAGRTHRRLGGELGASIGVGRTRLVGLAQRLIGGSASLRTRGGDEHQPLYVRRGRGACKFRDGQMVHAVVGRVGNATSDMRDRRQDARPRRCPPPAAASPPAARDRAWRRFRCRRGNSARDVRARRRAPCIRPAPAPSSVASR